MRRKSNPLSFKKEVQSGRLTRQKRAGTTWAWQI